MCSFSWLWKRPSTLDSANSNSKEIIYFIKISQNQIKRSFRLESFCPVSTSSTTQLMFNHTATEEQMCHYVQLKQAILSMLFYFSLNFYNFFHINPEYIIQPLSEIFPFIRTNESQFQALQIQILILQQQDGKCLTTIILIRTRTQSVLQGK